MSTTLSNKQYQSQVEDLFSALKTIEGYTEDPQLGPLYIQGAQKLSIFEKELSWVSAESIQLWYKSGQYRKKYLDYKRLYKKWKEEDVFFTIPDFIQFTNPADNPNRKVQILEELMQLADDLTQNESFANEMRLEFLEAELNFYLHPLESYILYPLESRAIEPPSLLTLVRKFLHNRLKYFVRRKLLCIKRDLRQSLRNIIHFLFKNMSDESDAVNFLFNNARNKKLLTVKIRHHDTIGNHRTTKANT